MIKGLCNPRITSTNAEVLRLLLKNGYLHELPSSSSSWSDDGQFTQVSSSSPHAVQLSPAAFLHWHLFVPHPLVQRHLMRWRTAAGSGRCWSSLDAIHLNQKKNLIIWYYFNWSLSRWYALDELPFSRLHPKPAGEESLGFGIISFFHTVAW